MIKFEDLKARVLYSIIGMEADNFSTLHYKVAQLSIKEGGLGLLNHSLVGKAAYVASIVSFHQKYLRVLLGNVNLALVPQDTLVGQFILLSKLFCGTDKLCPTVYELLDMKGTKIQTVQDQGILRIGFIKLMLTLFMLPSRRNRYIGLNGFVI